MVPSPSRRPPRTALVAGGIAVLLLVALVLVATQRGPVALPPDSPEATVQGFLQSMVDGQPDRSLLVDGVCDTPDASLLGDQRLRIDVDDVIEDGDTAVVYLAVTEQYGVGLFDDGYDHDEQVELDRTPDGWRITGFTWPWDDCWTTPRQEG